MTADDHPVPDGPAPAARAAADSRLRSAGKAMSRRHFRSLGTVGSSCLFTKTVLNAGSIASAEPVTRTVVEADLLNRVIVMRRRRAYLDTTCVLAA